MLNEKPVNRDERPNIVLIMADDMGFTDLACYGSEIRTPNLDRLGYNGMRFSQMYNYARCCPSRAALMTGLHPHQAGVGHMTTDHGRPGYQGYLNQSCVTVAEVLRAAGYQTLMSGKWHVGGDYSISDPDSTPPGDKKHPTPTQRGFDRFFGTLNGSGNYYDPSTLMRNETPVGELEVGFHYTDAIADNAVAMIDGAAGKDAPFFLYTAFTSPHWPLHALEDDIARFEGTYRAGWDETRKNRHEQAIGLGILDEKWRISPREVDSPAWEEARHKEWQDLRMAVFAAQIHQMDRGIGRMIARLEAHGVLDNTIFMFLCDNGGSAEFLAEDTSVPRPSDFRVTRTGVTVTVGNRPGVRPGAADTFMSYDMPWANASNSPFRLFKRWIHEGGVSTPFVVHWPARIKNPAIVDEPVQILDIPVTLLDAAGAAYPSEFSSRSVLPVEGESFLPLLEGRRWRHDKPIIWEHEGNRAVRVGEWKLVSEYPNDWELYNIDEDRTELNNLADGNSDRVAELSDLYTEWAARSDVVEWPPSEEMGRTLRSRLIGAHVHGDPGSVPVS